MKIKSQDWVVLIILVALMGVTVWFSPNEKTMGTGIKSVYVHVAFTWAGMLGLLLASIMGLFVLVRESNHWYNWMESTFWVSLVYLLMGVLVSFVAAKINWGAIDLKEPRVVANMQFLAVALIAKIIGGWVPWRRIQALLNVILLFVFGWLTVAAPLVLHPEQPVRNAGSVGIQLTFAILTVLMVLAGYWIALIINRNQRQLLGD